jgi:hypothetical protein
LGDKLKDNPLLEGWFQSQGGTLVITLLLLYSVLFFLMTWWLEQRAAAESEWLATDGGRRFVFAELLDHLPPQRRDEGGPVVFSFSEFVRAIVGHRRRSLPFPFFSHRLNPPAAEKLAKAHLDELESCGVIKRAPGRRLDIVYEMDADAVEDLRAQGSLPRHLTWR